MGDATLKLDNIKKNIWLSISLENINY